MTKIQFKKALKNETGCQVQHNGWCCGTCFFSLDNSLTNADWQSVLFYRGDYKEKELDNLPKNWKENIRKIYNLIQS